MSVLSDALESRFSELQTTFRAVSSKCENLTLESVRRIIRGQQNPSEASLRQVCSALDLNFEKHLEMCNIDDLRNK